MKKHTLRIRFLAIALSLAMLLSCMVWSGVSATVTDYLSYNFSYDDGNGASNADYWNIAAASNATYVSWEACADNPMAYTDTELTNSDGTKKALHITYEDNNEAGTYGSTAVFSLPNNTGAALNGRNDGATAYLPSGVPHRIAITYKADSLPADAAFYYGYNFGDLKSTSKKVADQTTELVCEVTEVTDGWVTKTGVITPPGSNGFYILLLSKDNANRSGTDVTIGGITVSSMDTTDKRTVTLKDTSGAFEDYVEEGVNGDTIDLSVFKRENYDVAWYTDEACTTPFTDTVFTDDNNGTTVYAGWTVNTALSTIRFETNGGEALADIAGEPGTAAELPTPVKGVYTFAGWYTDEALTEAAQEITFPAADTVITLYAKWTDPAPKPAGTANGVLLGTQTFESGTLDNFTVNPTYFTGVTADNNYTADGAYALATTVKKGWNGEVGRPRIVIKLGDATTAADLTVKEGYSYNVSFWVRTSAYKSTFQYYLATMGASDLSDKITATTKDHVLQTLGNGKTTATATLQAGQWTQLVATVPSVVLDDANDDNCLVLGYTFTDSHTSSFSPVDVCIDDIAVYKLTVDEEPTAWDMEALTAGEDVDLKTNYGTVSTTYSRSGNQSIQIYADTNSGTGRVQFLVKDKNGNDIKVKEGTQYLVTYWIYVPTQEGKNSAFAMNTWLSVEESAATAASGIPNALTVNSSVTKEQRISTLDTWVPISYVTDAATLSGSYLVCGLTNGGSYVSAGKMYCYVDDFAVTELGTTTNTALSDKRSGWLYVGGSIGKDLGAEENSPLFDDNGTTKAAIRVSATYETDAEDLGTVVLGGMSYTVKQRGILLGREGADLYLNSDYQKSADALTMTAVTDMDGGYWDYDAIDKKVTYSLLIKSTSATKDMALVARAYMIVTVGDTDYVMYSDTSDAFSAQSIYEAANAQWTAAGNEALAWFE